MGQYRLGGEAEILVVSGLAIGVLIQLVLAQLIQNLSVFHFPSVNIEHMIIDYGYLRYYMTIY